MFIKELQNLIDDFTNDLLSSGHKSDGNGFKVALRTFTDFLVDRPYISYVSDINRRDIEEYVDYLWKVPYEAQSGAYRPSFVYRRLRGLSRFFDYLTIKEDELPENMIPQSGLILRSDFPSPNRRGVKHLPAWFDEYYHKRILEIPADARNIRFRTMMLFIYHTGARSLDVCTTELDALFEKNDRHWIRIFSNKMRREYEIPIVDELYDAINEYINVMGEKLQGQKLQKHPVTKQDAMFLFSYKGVPGMLKDSFSRKIKQFSEVVLEQAESGGYDVSSLRDLRITSHKFRHNISIKLTRMGADPMLVAEFLGHSDLSMAQAYIQEDMDYIDELFMELEEDELENEQPIIVKKAEILEAGDVVSKTNVGWCVHINGETPCGNDPYQCWNCEKLEPKKGEEYKAYLESQYQLHQKLYERNVELGFNRAEEAEKSVLNRIEVFLKRVDEE